MDTKYDPEDAERDRIGVAVSTRRHGGTETHGINACLYGLRKRAPWQPSTSRRRRAARTHELKYKKTSDPNLLVFHVLVFSRVGRNAANDVDGCPCPRVGIFVIRTLCFCAFMSKDM